MTSRSRLVPVVIMAVTALLLFVRLDDMYLWHDEAQTATIAVNTLRFGYPRAWDGVNLLTHLEGNDFNDHFVHVSSPWLQFYVCAASLWVLGRTTLAARLPFALAGLATVAAVWILARRLYRRDDMANLTAALLACSVPFLLYSRQCRYYPLVMLFTATATYCYFGLWRSGTRSVSAEQRGLAVSLILLFYSNHLAFGIWGIAAGVHSLAAGPKRLIPRALWPVAVSLACTVPWLLYTAAGTPTAVAPDIGFRLLVLAWKVQAYFVPFVTLAAIAAAVRLATRRGKTRWVFGRRTVFFPILAAAHVAVIAVPDWYLLNHYLIGMVVAVPFIISGVAVWLARISRPLAVAVVVVCVSTNVLHVAPYLIYRKVANTPAVAEAAGTTQWVAPGSSPAVAGLLASPDTRADLLLVPLSDYLETVAVTSYPILYLRELTSRYDAPNRAVVDILRERASPGDTVLVRGIEYEHIVFYTGLRVVNRLSPLALADAWSRFYEGFPNLKYDYLTQVPDDEIDWVILHTQGRPLILDDPDYLSDRPDLFEVIPTGTVDLFLSNSPDLDYHRFVTVTEGPQVLVLRRKRGDD